MKTARIILAVLSLAALGACGNDSITGSMAPGGARHETAPATEDGGTIDGSTDATLSGDGTTDVCDGTLVQTVDSSGNVITTCVTDDEKGGQYGSGG